MVNLISRIGNVRDKSGTILWQKAGELKITVVMSEETGLNLKGLTFVKDGTVLEEKPLWLKSIKYVQKPRIIKKQSKLKNPLQNYTGRDVGRG